MKLHIDVKYLRCGIFGFCLLSFRQNERKIYKLRQLSLVLFVCFLMEVCLLFKKIHLALSSFKNWKVNTFPSKKYTNWDKLSCLSLYIFLSFWGNEKRQKPNIPHLRDVWIFAQFCNFQTLQSVFFISSAPACEERPLLKNLTCKWRKSALHINFSFLDSKKDNFCSK